MGLDVCAIQRGCVYDGPGVRTTVFLRGCTLRCPWCCNPETVYTDRINFTDDSRCLLLKGYASELCRECERNGGERLLLDCPFGVVYPSFKTYSEETLLSAMLRDDTLYKASEGGVTFSGGEPLMHSRQLVPVLEQLHRYDVSVFFETTLMVDEQSVIAILNYTDGFIVDIKLQPEMFLHTSSYYDQIKQRLKLLRGKRVAFRMVYVDSLRPYAQEVCSALSQMGVNKVELLLCHNLAGQKYVRLGLPFRDMRADSVGMEEFMESMRLYHICVSKLSL